MLPNGLRKGTSVPNRNRLVPGIPYAASMSDLVTLAEIEQAAARLTDIAVRSPLIPFPLADPVLFIKAESLQPTGAFKIRGAYAAISALVDREKAGRAAATEPLETAPASVADAVAGVVTHSSGNHAQAVAYAARSLGIPAVLVIPNTTPGVKIQACQRLGAEIVFVEPTMEARVDTAQRLATSHGYELIPPFDHPQIIAGQGTLGCEIIEDAPDTDVVLVPVGGGGLISGVAAAIKALRPATKVIGVEPELAADARDSFLSGRRIAWTAEDTARTSADALCAQQLGELTFKHIRAHVDDIITVTEDEIATAMRRLAREVRLISEPAGAVATAGYLFHQAELPKARTYVSVLSGGNVDPALFARVIT